MKHFFVPYECIFHFICLEFSAHAQFWHNRTSILFARTTYVFKKIFYYIFVLRQSASLPSNLATVGGLTAQKSTVARSRCSGYCNDLCLSNQYDILNSCQTGLLESVLRVPGTKQIRVLVKDLNSRIQIPGLSKKHESSCKLLVRFISRDSRFLQFHNGLTLGRVVSS